MEVGGLLSSLSSLALPLSIHTVCCCLCGLLAHFAQPALPCHLGTPSNSYSIASHVAPARYMHSGLMHGICGMYNEGHTPSSEVHQGLGGDWQGAETEGGRIRSLEREGVEEGIGVANPW